MKKLVKVELSNNEIKLLKQYGCEEYANYNGAFVYPIVSAKIQACIKNLKIQQKQQLGL